ncbi:MAG: PP2C family protein-serine/threonine phosphatase, partial [Planctomycetaceae bacterium]
ASLYLFDAETEELFTRIVTELEIEEIRSSIENGITGWVARRRRIANIPDPQVDARWNSAIDRQTGYTTRNILAAPLISQHDGRFVGVLQLLNKIDASFDEFDEQMLEAFASHAATALERVELLQRARQSQELRVSIDVARQIQTSLLPGEIPALAGYEIAVWWEPAEQVSGDYYDMLPLPDGRLGLVVADVSGHGVGPSLIMASVRAMLKLLAGQQADLQKIVSQLSAAVDPDLHDGRFFTMLLAALDPRSHELSYVNAGQSPAFVFDRERRQTELLPPTRLPIGFPFEETDRVCEPRTMRPGDVLLAATDGLIELRDDSGEQFGRTRLEEIVRDHCDSSAGEIVAAIKRAVETFAPGDGYLDDVTLMIVKRVPSEPA